MIFANLYTPEMFLKITSIKRTLFQVMYMTMTSNQVIERNFVTFSQQYEQNGGMQYHFR